MNKHFVGQYRVSCFFAFVLILFSNVVSADQSEDVWQLDNGPSYFHFVSYKNQNKVESHSFESLQGHVTTTGAAILEIDLNSVNTANSTRNQRLRQYLFETSIYQTAVVQLNVDPNLMAQIVPGQRVTTPVTALLQLHGVEMQLNTELFVTRLTDSRFMVQNASPVLVNAFDFGLEDGLNTLRELAGLDSIGAGVPVDFMLYFDAPVASD